MTEEAEPIEHEPTEITYSEQFYPARPRALRPRARLRPQGSPTHGEDRTGEPLGTNPFYVAWLQRSSMLHDANVISSQFSGQGSMWQNPFAEPNPRLAVEAAGVWFTAYPLSMMTKPGHTFLGTFADPELWRTFAAIGIEAVHTGPVKRAGGLAGWEPTPSVDGHFDRVSTEIDEVFGTEGDFRVMCDVAADHGGTIIDDIVPGHTGKGADFRLAEMGVGDYPGVYHMVQIDPLDWGLLPEVPPGRDSQNLDAGTEHRLGEGGLHRRRAAAGHLLRPGRQGHQLERDPRGGRARRRRAALGLPALLQGGPALDQLARPFLRRHAAGDRRRPALARRPRVGGTAAGRQRLPRRREERRRAARLVGGPPALGGRQPPDREHGPQDRRLHLPGAQPQHRRHPGDRRGRRRPQLRLHQPPGLPARAGTAGHRVPAAHAQHVAGVRRAADRPGPCPPEPRRADLRAGALREPAPGPDLQLPGRGDHRRTPGRDDPGRAPGQPDWRPRRRTTWSSRPTASPRRPPA